MERRIPTILGILILIGGIAAGVYFVGKDLLFKPKSSPDLTPKKVKITNVAKDQFTISWMTTKATGGFIRFGTTPTLNTTVADDREQRSGTSVNSTIHYVTVTGLNPNTKYYFKIGSGSENNLFDNNGRPYEISTAPSLGAQPGSILATGKVLEVSGAPAAGAIIYLNLPQAAPLSTVIANDGSWIIPLSTALKSDLTGYLEYDNKETQVDILVQAEKDTAKATVLVINSNPVPQITLGQTYDFRTQTVSSPQPTATESAIPEVAVQEEVPSQFPTEPIATPSASTGSATTVQFTNPSREGETIGNLRPQLMGTGPARKVLTVTLESPKTYTSTVVVGADGRWNYTPPENLTAGNHSLTISYVDEGGTQQTVKRNFIVAAAGSTGLPSFTATPSASATPSAAPRVTIPSTSSGVPTSGSVGPTLVLFLIGLTFLGFGFTLRLSRLKGR